MSNFPKTIVGGISVSRMIIGTNFFMGFSHCSVAKDEYIKEHIMNRNKMADVFEVFLRAGVNAIIGQITVPPLADAVKEAEDRTGQKLIVVATPSLPVNSSTPVQGFDLGETARILDEQVKFGSTFCMPHQQTTDAMVDRCTRKIRQMDTVCKMIRERGMIPGLSTHMSEAIVYADESGLDVETYIALYNSMGFLMQIEVDWVAKVIREARKPVMTIKPMASGQLRPFQALTFVWNTIRPQDMVAVGTMSPKEAAEVIEISLSILESREAKINLQETRSKKAVKKKA